MAQPNLLAISTITGKTLGKTLGTNTNETLITCPADTVYKINSITIAVKAAGDGAEVFVDFFDSSENENLALAGGADPGTYDITFVNVVTKDTAIYLEEGDEIQAWALAADLCDLVMSYEEIT